MAMADPALAIADHDECCKAEAFAALHRFRDAIDMDELFNQLFATLFSALATTVITTPAIAITATASTTACTIAAATSATATGATTLGSRLGGCSFNSDFSALVFGFVSHLSELQSALAGRLSKRFHTPVIQKTSAIEHNLGYASFLGAFGNRLAHRSCGIHRRAGFGTRIFFERRGRNHRCTGFVVNDLRIDMPARTVNGKTCAQATLCQKRSTNATTPLFEE
jgi:hypothetical protein